MNLPVLPNSANEVARSLTGRDYLSYSQITMFQACPLKWYFQYVAGLPHEFVGSGLVFGSAVHTAIEVYHRAEMAGHSRPNLDDLQNAFRDSWKSETTAPLQLGKGETVDELHDLGGRVLQAFLDSEKADPGGTIIGIEEEIRATYIDGLPDFLARLDLIVLIEDGLLIRDYKTSRSAWTQAKLDDAAPQLLLYGDMSRSLADEFEDQPIRLEVMVLTKTKTPAIDRFAVESDVPRLARTRTIIERVWAGMRAGHVYPNPSAMNCGGCGFQQACRRWQG